MSYMDQGQRHSRAVKLVRWLLDNHVNATEHQSFWIGNLFLKVRVRRGAIEVRGLHLDRAHRGTGQARRAFKKLMRYIDQQHLPCRLTVNPYDAHMTKAQTIAWYAQFGFALCPPWHNVMRREPKEKL